ncbi:hypothetical protein NQZ68_033146 [Dissostichus eleginoides]|nr:hypothetical protein NQZ68_033146 [Dissostichus eleginoides]
MSSLEREVAQQEVALQEVALQVGQVPQKPASLRMVVVVLEMVVVTQPGSDAAAEWASGVCDCCQDKRQCCLWFWCCPCSACRLSKSLGQCLCLPLLDVCGCVRPISFSMRVLVRQRYGIRWYECKVETVRNLRHSVYYYQTKLWSFKSEQLKPDITTQCCKDWTLEQRQLFLTL